MHKSRKLDLVSMYMNQPVLGARVVALELDESRPGHLKGKARMDPNTCSLDLWGDRQSCTRMAIRDRDVEATLMRTYDSQGHRRVHWRLHVEDAPDATVALVEYPRANLWYLTVQTEQEGTSVVPLFDADLFAIDAVGTVQTRYGVALREVLQRGDLDEMRGEAEVVRRALAELEAQPAAARGGRSLDPTHVEDVRAALAELEQALAKVKD